MKHPGLWLLVAASFGVIVGHADVMFSEGWAAFSILNLLWLAKSLRVRRGVFVAALGVLTTVVAWRASHDAVGVRLPSHGEKSRWIVRVHGQIDYFELGGTKPWVKARAELDLVAQQVGGAWQPRRGRVRVVLTTSEPLARGDVLDVALIVRPWPRARNLGERSPDEMRLWFGVDGRARARSKIIFRARQHGWLASLERIRLDSLRAVHRQFPHRVSLWVSALALGSRASMDRDYRTLWSRAGLAHLLAISGLHVGSLMFAMMGLFALALRQIPPLVERYSVASLAGPPTLLAIWGFCFLAGAPVSALRAALMGSVLLAGVAGGYRSSGLNALGVAGVMMALSEPRTLGQPGWLLSFSAAALLLIWLGGPKPRGVLQWLCMALKVSWLAWLATSAWCILFFGQISWVGPWMNVIAVPWVTWLVLPVSMLCAALSGVGQRVPELLIRLLDGSLRWLEQLVHASLEIPGADSYLWEPSLSQGAALGAFLIMLLINLVARRVGLLVLGLLIGGLVVSGFSKRWGEDAPRSLSIELPYVGHGDGTLLRLPDGKVMVIDSPGPLRPGGWDPGRDVMAKILERRGVERIDVVVMTHPHWDHVGGFDYLSRRFSISEVWIGGELPKKNSRLARILERIRAQGGRVIVARDLARRFERGEITIEVIHPLRSSSPADDLNDDSLVLRLVYGERSILFTGDMTSRVERLRVARWLPTDIVKVPHHGSDTSSSEAFIRQVATEVALVSCAAEQREGIPSVDVLERYRRQGAKVLRTDLDGTISLWTDGKEWRVRTRQQADALVDINPR